MIGITEDLAAEQEALDAVVGHVDGTSWCEQTPAKGWNVADQIGHLTFFDERATMAITDRSAFSNELVVAAGDINGYMDGHLESARTLSSAELLDRWRAGRRSLSEALIGLDPSDRIPWYGPDMSARSFATARLMEVWAHGQDVVDALGVHRRATDRLRHVALLGVRTFGWSFTVNGLPVPATGVLVDLAGPSGDRWVWGEPDASEVVRGDAEEFCLVVTQRRNIADTDLTVEGDVAHAWMEIAQAYAGPPGEGRAPTNR